MDNTKNKLQKKDIWFFGGLGLFSTVMCIYFFAHEMSEYNTSLYALSYKYGFISRGIIGTLWQALDSVLPFDLMTYHMIYYANIVITALFYLLLFVFFIWVIRRLDGENKRNVKYLIIFFFVCTIPMYVTRQHLGRIDIYLIAITVICVWLIILEKAEWLIIPLCVIAMLIHQGFVFTNVNIVLVLLFVKILTSERKKKYIIIFSLTFLVVAVLFLYFEFGREYITQENYDEIVDVAKRLSPNGRYYEMLFKHELLGQDVYEDESFWHLNNRVEFPLFLVLVIPYIILAIKFFVGIFKKTITRTEKWVYLFVTIGSMTLLPEWILKVDFGRYVYFTVFYYVVIVIALVCMKDKIITESLQDTKMYLKKLSPLTVLLVIYPILFMPFYDTEISNLTYQILRFVGFRE